MTIRAILVTLFLVYGTLLPLAAPDFLATDFITALAMIGSCFVISLMLWLERALLLNVLIALYVIRVYLTLPYIDVFTPTLSGDQYEYIRGLHSYYNPADAKVVFLSLFSLLLAWLLGLLAYRPTRFRRNSPPQIFQKVDEIVTKRGVAFWLALLGLFALNYKSASQSWLGVSGEDSGGLFAYGLFAPDPIMYVCLCAFVHSYHSVTKRSSIDLLIPAIVTAGMSALGGSRSAIFALLVFVVSYWIFLNFRNKIGRHAIAMFLGVTLLLPLTIFSGLLAQFLRPLFRAGVPAAEVWDATLEGLDLFNPNNPVVNSFNFGFSELLHRLSSLNAQFLILNDRFIHEPWTTYNPVATSMRIINDLVPGDVFTGMLTINQLFDYIYYDSAVFYNSVNWSVQGTLYLYFGHWFAPIVVFLLAFLLGGSFQRVSALATSSPSFAAFFILLFSGFIEFGTFERAIPDGIIRPIGSFIAMIVLMWPLQILFKKKGHALSKHAVEVAQPSTRVRERPSWRGAHADGQRHHELP